MEPRKIILLKGEKKVKRLMFVLVSLVIVASMALAGCAQATPAATEAASTEAAAATTAAPAATAEPVTIRVMTFFAHDNPEVEEAVVAAFEAAHPNIKVQLEQTSYDDIFTKYTADVAAGTPADVISMNYENLRKFAGLNALEPLNDYVTRDNYDTSIYYANTLDMHTVDGVLYGLPATFSDNVLYFNKSMFDAAGIAYPDSSWDWNKLIEVSKQFVKDTDGDGVTDQYGYGPAWWPMYLFEYNTNVLTADGTKCALNTPEGLQAMQAYVDLSTTDGVTANAAAQASQGDYDRFIAGKLAMYDAGPWAVAPFNQNITSFTWDVAENPAGTVKGTFLYSNAYAISAASTQKDAAWEFIKFATGAEGSTIRQQGKFEISAVKSVAESIFVSSMKGTSPEHPEVFMDSVAFGQRLSENARFQEMMDAIQPELDQALAGTKTVEQAMNDACDVVNSMIAEQ
jgi:multiple sugar transport system substrate-binding protein